MANAELGDKGVYRAELDAASAAGVPQLGRANVVFAVGNQQGKGGEPLNDPVPRTRAAETLKEFLKHEARGKDRVTGLKRARKECGFGVIWNGSLSVDLTQALIDASVPFVSGVTSVDVDLDNILTAISEAGSSATIGKKDFQGFSVTAVVPEPSTALLLGFGLMALAAGKRRS